jgi:hypothetical protein
MAVYVDDMYLYPIGQFRGMKMSHMIADTVAELHAMADRLGLKRSWFQGDHYDIAIRKRTLAIQYGAVSIEYRTCGLMCWVGHRTGTLPKPEEAERIWRELRTIEVAKAPPGGLF